MLKMLWTHEAQRSESTTFSEKRSCHVIAVVLCRPRKMSKMRRDWACILISSYISVGFFVRIMRRSWLYKWRWIHPCVMSIVHYATLEAHFCAYVGHCTQRSRVSIKIRTFPGSVWKKMEFPVGSGIYLVFRFWKFHRREEVLWKIPSVWDMEIFWNCSMNIYDLLLLRNQTWKFPHVLILSWINNIWHTTE